jgi:hypothetical protein
VKRLNTKPNKGSRIEISDNKMIVVDSLRTNRIYISDEVRGRSSDFSNELNDKSASLDYHTDYPYYPGVIFQYGPPIQYSYEQVLYEYNFGTLYKGDAIYLSGELQYANA